MSVHLYASKYAFAQATQPVHRHTAKPSIEQQWAWEESTVVGHRDGSWIGANLVCVERVHRVGLLVV